MIGVSGSRHIGRRRGSTVSTQQHRLSIIESDIHSGDHNDNDDENVDGRYSQRLHSQDSHRDSKVIINNN
ncbi:hypothetical protein BLA29_011391 [Euroglyphus maynei]|uniref:Uncharacterized protein n=1 Tax=Euroglyphus maynei TaxID=6958 RepID=A0A1Y3AMW3_EURMA|nr:hypothetical protein BLA29_011391 [Euroglyphus maynei]